MALLYRLFVRLTVVVFILTAALMAIATTQGFRDDSWVILTLLFGPATMIALLAWVVKPAPLKKPSQPNSP
jgi:hypothetical protein